MLPSWMLLGVLPALFPRYEGWRVENEGYFSKVKNKKKEKTMKNSRFCSWCSLWEFFYRNDEVIVLLVTLPGFERAIETRSRGMESPGSKASIIVLCIAPTKNNCVLRNVPESTMNQKEGYIA